MINGGARLLIVLMLVIWSGCMRFDPATAKHDPRYSQMVGKRFELVRPVRALGVMRWPESKVIEQVLLVGDPGVGGPEFKFLGTIPAGTLLEIIDTEEELLGPIRRFNGHRVRLFGKALPELGELPIRLHPYGKSGGFYSKARGPNGEVRPRVDYLRPVD